MGNGTKFKLSNVLPNVFSKIKGIKGRKPKSRGGAAAAGAPNPGDWSSSEAAHDYSTASKMYIQSPERTFEDGEMVYSPNHSRTYDIRFPIESPIRKGPKSRPISPPRRSPSGADSRCYSFDSTLGMLPQERIRRAVPLLGRCLTRSKCNSFNSDTFSDSDLEGTEDSDAGQNPRARTRSLQLDRTDREWTEPVPRRRRPKDLALPSPIHTVRCMPPTTPSEAGNYSDPCDLDHRSACPDFSREMSPDHEAPASRFDRQMSFGPDDSRMFYDTYTSFSSDDDAGKVRPGGRNVGSNRSARYGVLLTEDEHRSLQREAVLGRAVRSVFVGEGRLAEEKVRKVVSFAEEGIRPALVKKVLTAANEAERPCSKPPRPRDSEAEYETFDLPVIFKDQLLSRAGSRKLEGAEKPSKGAADFDEASDTIANYERFSQPLAEFAGTFYRKAQADEPASEVSLGVKASGVEFPSFRSDRGSRRPTSLDLPDSEVSGPLDRRFSVQERVSKESERQYPSRNGARDSGVKKSFRTSTPKSQEGPVAAPKASSRSGSPRRQDFLGGKRTSSPKVSSQGKQESGGKKNGRVQSPRRSSEAPGRAPTSNGTEVKAHGLYKHSNARAEGHSHSTAYKTRPSSHARVQDDRSSVMGSDSVAVVKASYDPYQDFRESMVEMIMENDIQTAEDLEELLQCYLSLNSAEYHSIIVQVFSDIWRDIFDH